MRKLILITLLAFIKVDAQIINTVAGNGYGTWGAGGFSGDGGLATNAALNGLTSAVPDAAGNIYIVDNYNNRIRKVNTSGIITTIAGTGAAGYTGDNGLAVNAELNDPTEAAIDAAGNLYIVDDANSCIRKINSTGVITTIVGTGTSGFSGDGGQASNAQLSYPYGMNLDALGNIYIADTYNNRIRKINSTGIITTIAGTGTANYNGDGGQATAAEIDNPLGVLADGAGNVYFSDNQNARIRKIDASGIITTVAGTGQQNFSADGGQATAAELEFPSKLAIDASGNLYISDTYSHRIRMVNTLGIISTIAGNGTKSFNGDGGQASAAELNTPVGIAFDAMGNYYIADYGNNRVRKVTAASGCGDCLGINELSVNKEELTLYPNPASTFINIEFKTQNEAQNRSIEIYNMLGTSVYKQTTSTASNQINIADLNSGVYIIEITGNNQKVIKRLVKE